MPMLGLGLVYAAFSQTRRSLAAVACSRKSFQQTVTRSGAYSRKSFQESTCGNPAVSEVSMGASRTTGEAKRGQRSNQGSQKRLGRFKQQSRDLRGMDTCLAQGRILVNVRGRLEHDVDPAAHDDQTFGHVRCSEGVSSSAANVYRQQSRSHRSMTMRVPSSRWIARFCLFAFMATASAWCLSLQ